MLTLAGCVILDQDLRILLLHRNTPGRVQWELPGGKIDDGEEAQSTAIRELQEELGVHVTITGDLGGEEFTEDGHVMHYRWFLAAVVSGTPQPMEAKFDEVRFFDWDELSRREDLSPNTRNLLAARTAGRLGHLHSRERRTLNELAIEPQRR